MEYFTIEKEAVAHAFSIIKADSNANKHLIGFVKTEDDLQNLKQELESRGVPYDCYVLFYSKEPPRNRFCLSVFGCDVQKVKDLENRYGYHRNRA
ncbi:hypothetical protein HH214_16270 [Mucilaginibacter robiniae]|uniref:Uncharacterized protein n=1 Tax=Mucilaginibacter robiniae TaxID=2728022 RepID=A0A7L5E1S5_9SPHI|nr:hypothetical protein [Mucilaginibacter robiniae]QJD97312.1 hypothetical protein HH214_16270 [Mucilaginibacter robiniae]